MKGKRKPDYGRLVDLLTKAAIKEMVIPSMLPFLSNSFVYNNSYYWQRSRFISTWCNVIRSNCDWIICCNLDDSRWWSLTMQKYIEDGNFGGKGSEAHKAAVTGDTVATHTKILQDQC